MGCAVDDVQSRLTKFSGNSPPLIIYLLIYYYNRLNLTFLTYNFIVVSQTNGTIENMNVSELEESNRYNRKCNTTIQKLCYGLGHVYNDLCAAMWFSYTLFYLQIVLQIESRTAGILIMLGKFNQYCFRKIICY